MGNYTICRSSGEYLAGLGTLLGRIDPQPIEALAELIYQAWGQGRRVFVFGNGGSASTASHWACDLVKTAAVEGKPRLQALCLADNLGLLSALGNDISFDETFRYPLATFARAGDLAVGISASGNSPNILAACRWGVEHDLKVVALTGFAGGKVKDIAPLHINVPSENYGFIEDLHLSIGHMVAQNLKARITCGG